ncbi:helix-turn-helix domain-containing protein [Nocardia sp. N2S4-5]|uniref:helix-turn-helix domain-containing protein n=1 Tax=Nocardia sp. N2S4-5 TaxID=3351565 RepID=UPI0037D24B6F
MGDSSITRRELGRLLREAREAIGLTLDSASRLLDWGSSTLQRYEKGQNQKIRDRDLDAMIEIYRIDPEQGEALRGLAKEAAEKEGVVRRYWEAYERIRQVALDEIGNTGTVAQ